MSGTSKNEFYELYTDSRVVRATVWHALTAQVERFKKEPPQDGTCLSIYVMYMNGLLDTYKQLHLLVNKTTLSQDAWKDNKKRYNYLTALTDSIFVSIGQIIYCLSDTLLHTTLDAECDVEKVISERNWIACLDDLAKYDNDITSLGKILNTMKTCQMMTLNLLKACKNEALENRTEKDNVYNLKIQQSSVFESQKNEQARALTITEIAESYDIA